MTLTPKEKKIPYSVSDAYPNPCTESTRMLISVSEKSGFKVLVMENGLELKTHHSEEFSPGIATMDIPLSDLPSGHYILRIVQGHHQIDKHIHKIQKGHKKG